MKLAHKLLLLVLALSIAPIAIVGYLAYHTGRDAVEQQTADRVVSTNLLKSSEAARWLAGSKRSIEELAQRPLVRQHARILAPHDTSTPARDAARAHLLADHLKPRLRHGGFSTLFLLCPDTGRILASTPRTYEGQYRDAQPYFVEGRIRTHVQGVYHSPTLERLAITIGTPVTDDAGRLIAVLAGHLDLNELSQIMALQTGQSETEDSYLVSRTHSFVTDPRFDSAALSDGEVHTEGIDSCLSGRDGVGFYTDYRGVPVIGAYHWLPDHDLCVVTEVDQAEAFAPIRRLQRVVAAIAGATATAVALLASLFARTLTRPLKKLLAGAEAVGAGDLDVVVGTDAADEIGELSRAFDRMVERLKSTTVSRDRLAESEQRFRIAAASASDLIWDWDLTTDDIEWFGDIDGQLGYDPGEFPRTLAAWEEAVHPDDVSRVMGILERHIASGESYHVEYRIAGKDGAYRYWTEQGTPLRDENGQAFRAIGASSDITERKLAEQQVRAAQAELERLLAEAEQSRRALLSLLEDQKAAEESVRQLNVELERRVGQRTAQLEAANQELEAFAYSVSHDLRAPLRAMDGFSAALRSQYRDQLDPQARHYLDRIQAGSRRMGQLITDLLDLSRVTRREMAVTPVDLTALARQIAAELVEEDPQRDVDFAIEEGLTVEGDPHLLRIALYNLLSNAWKFTGRQDRARIEVGRLSDTPAGSPAGAEIGRNGAVYFVRDNGVGFDMAYADKLFAPFQRLHTLSEFPGTGIGLVTVRRIVTRHGGQVWTEAEVDRGAAFYFTLGGG
ncbi:MAG: PAS domain-containing protein [Chloroflexota bacterium]